MLRPPVVLIGFRPKLRPLARRGTAPPRRLSEKAAGGMRCGCDIVVRVSLGREVIYTCIMYTRIHTYLYRGIPIGVYTYKWIYLPLIYVYFYISLYRNISDMYIYPFEGRNGIKIHKWRVIFMYYIYK